MQICRRGRNDSGWCYSRHRNHFGSRLCRSNAQVDPKTNGATACLTRARCSMLELYASKGACTVLRGREWREPLLLPDVRHEGVAETVLLFVKEVPTPAVLPAVSYRGVRPW